LRAIAYRLGMILFPTPLEKRIPINIGMKRFTFYVVSIKSTAKQNESLV